MTNFGEEVTGAPGAARDVLNGVAMLTVMPRA